MKKIIFTALALSSIMAKAQLMIGTNTKINELVGGVNFNGYGYYIMASKFDNKSMVYNTAHNERSGDAFLRGDKELGTVSNKSGFTLMGGYDVVNDEDVSVGLHLGMKHTSIDYYELWKETRELGVYGAPEDDYKYVIGAGWTNIVTGMIGMNVRYKMAWVNMNLDIESQKVDVQFGIAIPMGEMGSCGRF